MDSVNPPAHAWHTLSALVAENGNWSVLSFGGDGGPSEAVQTQADSTWLLSVHSAGNSVNYTHEPTSWANQPMRRMYHSTASSGNGGRTYISGGLKDDGSGTTFADVYLYDPASSAFTALPGLPQAIYHHSSVLLSNGTLIVLGGVYTSPVTESAAVIPFSTLYVLDTTSNVATWVTQTVVGNVPTGRRGATAVLNGIETTAFVFGGADAALATVFGDGWELDLSSCTWQQVVTGDQGG